MFITSWLATCTGGEEGEGTAAMSAAGGGGGERQESKRGALRALNIIDH